MFNVHQIWNLLYQKDILFYLYRSIFSTNKYKEKILGEKICSNVYHNLKMENNWLNVYCF